MPNIVHRIGSFKVTPQEIYDAVSTVAGLARWWTTNITGESKIGNRVHFQFSKGGPDFEVIDLVPNKRVEWKCVQGPKEWIDTHIEFDIRTEEKETILVFKHSRWREEVEFMNHCCTQWAYFLIGLRQLLETGKGTPYGGGAQPISHWS